MRLMLLHAGTGGLARLRETEGGTLSEPESGSSSEIEPRDLDRADASSSKPYDTL
jgi:hypothetical protein